MKSFSLPYGDKSQTFLISADLEVDEYLPKVVSPAVNPIAAVHAALINHTNGNTLDPYRGAQRVVIAINDNTRPVPNHLILPPLLANLHQNGIQKDQICFLIATGTHKPLNEDQLHQLLPEETLSQYSVKSHDCDNQAALVNLGNTQSGTPVAINRQFMEADMRIVVGNIEPHHFMGFSGGVKTAGIGLAGRETINCNHAMLSLPGSTIGQYISNPIRSDLEEIGAMIGDMLALNVVLNADREIVAAFAGDPVSVMQAGIPVARQVCQTPVDGQYDLVIASAGGYPKDLNLYQAQKALSHASLFTRDGGVVILVSACSEGVGSDGYLHFMQGVTSLAQVYEKFEVEGFRVGPHKAIQIARDLSRIEVILLSEIPESIVKQLLLKPANSPTISLGLAFNVVGNHPRIAVLPKATNIIPLLSK